MPLAAKEEILSTSSDPCVLFPLAAFEGVAENSRLGFERPNRTLHQGWSEVNSTNALGIEPALRLEGIRSRSTGQERDSETGNDNFGARYFGSSMGRFLSPDPGPWIFTNPQSFNAYAYGLNNPIRYADDGGETAEDRVAAANSFASQNIPYLWGGKNPNCGLDCSGLVQNVFLADPNNTIPALGTMLSAGGQAAALQQSGQFSTNINDAQPGDAIFFSDPSTGKIVHTGIVVDIRDGKVYFVHAPNTRYPVKRDSIYRYLKPLHYGNERFAGVGRPIEGNPNSPGMPSSANNNPGLFSSATDGLSNLLEELFFNQDFNAPPPPPPPPAPPGEVCSQLGDQDLGCQ